MTRATTPNLLAAIVAGTRAIVEQRQRVESITAIERRAAARQPAGESFTRALGRPGALNVIAECKRRSPSRGVLRQDYDPAAIAKGYQAAGAAAISVLTEPTFFDGSLEHLQAVRAAVSCPLLRKDFVVDEYQLLEAVACGADAVLLIVCALTDHELGTLHRAADGLGLAVLVEVHDPGELDRALAADARIVGVNNRDLRTLEVNTRASEQVAARIPAGVISVSESGLRTSRDLTRMRALGYNAALIGERFMTAPDPGAALAELMA
jgi:indole-3-glycerol phosphate synthase